MISQIPMGIVVMFRGSGLAASMTMKKTAYINTASCRADGGLIVMEKKLMLKKLFVNARQSRDIRHFKYWMARTLGFNCAVAHRIQDFTFGHFKQYAISNYTVKK